MRATVLEGPRQVVVHDVPDPVLPGSEGVIVTVEQHRHLRFGPPPVPRRSDRGRHPVGPRGHRRPWPRPGPTCTACTPGDRVLVSGVVGCGLCGPCRSGLPNLCLAGKSDRLRHHARPARAARPRRSRSPSPTSSSSPIPDGVPDEAAVLLTDILPTGYVGAVRASITPGSTVVVVGLGPVGVMAVQCAALFGPARILAIDMVPERLARAERLGAEPDRCPRVRPAIVQVLEATKGRGRRVGHRGRRRRRHHRRGRQLRRDRRHRSRSSASTSTWTCPSPWAWSSSRA